MLENLDQVLIESPLGEVQALVEGIEKQHTVRLVREPEVCLTMLRAEDSLDAQEFFLGEALTTSCEVSVDGTAGFGMCLGEEPVRAYCVAVFDALRERQAIDEALFDTLAQMNRRSEERDRREFAQTLRTQVDFKLLEQE
ncbi:MAG: phosphonate C-P lyase system protein PhnG [Acidobacteriota bacterium]|jgi:alpha-D-ribose 1-methylphosphonate 5-triphosphate synthase subunit PhnG